MGWIASLSLNSYFEILIPSHSDVNLFGDRVLKRWLGQNEVGREGSNSIGFKVFLGDLNKDLYRGMNIVKTQGDDGCLQAKEGGLRRH